MGTAACVRVDTVKKPRRIPPCDAFQVQSFFVNNPLRRQGSLQSQCSGCFAQPRQSPPAARPPRAARGSGLGEEWPERQHCWGEQVTNSHWVANCFQTGPVPFLRYSTRWSCSNNFRQMIEPHADAASPPPPALPAAAGWSQVALPPWRSTGSLLLRHVLGKYG